MIGKPTTITTKYPGKCHDCHKPIQAGQTAAYYKGLRRLRCQPCWWHMTGTLLKPPSRPGGARHK